MTKVGPTLFTGTSIGTMPSHRGGIKYDSTRAVEYAETFSGRRW